jgi:uncharacterized membrane protein YcaP (DUF421 family)
MNPEEFGFFDLERIFMGDVPLDFLLEVIIRITFLFFLIVVSMRLVGQRMASSINKNDLAATVSIAAAIGIPMQEPTRGLLPAVVIAFVIVGIIKIINRLMTNNPRFEAAVQGRTAILIQDGVIDVKNLQTNVISRQRLFSQLRSERIESLGQVYRLYLEASGSYTLIRNTEPKPGLSTIPSWDKDFGIKETDMVTCQNCGFLSDKELQICPKCYKKVWVKAVKA